MSRDPVCGMEVSEDSQWFTSYQGQTYYFCAKGCKEEFDQAPDHFAARMVADGAELTPDAYPTTGTEVEINANERND